MDEETKEVMKEMLEYLEMYNDEGPVGEGWQSNKLQVLIKRAEKILKNK